MKNEQVFKLKLMLYEPVASVQHTVSGPDVRITLTKSKSIEWPRLILTKQYTRNIHYDLSMLEVNEERHLKFMEIAQKVDVDSESDDGEIDMMYENYSDLDSEFDYDQESD